MREIRYVYAARMTADADGRLTVRFPDVPEALTDGTTFEDAMAEAQDALSTALIGYVLDGRPVPQPSAPRRGQHLVAPHPRTSLKIALATEAKRQGIRAAELARRLGVDHKEARRILDPRHPTTADRLAEALGAIGVGVSVGVYDAASRAKAA
jgi:antitoxin HicB